MVFLKKTNFRAILYVFLLSCLSYLGLIFLPGFDEYSFLTYTESKLLKIHTFKKNAQYYQIGNLLKTELESKNITLEVLESKGSVDNLRKVNNNPNEIALTQYDAFMSDDYENVNKIEEIYFEQLHIIVNCFKVDCDLIDEIDITFNSKIKELLENSNIGEENSGTNLTMTSLLNSLGKVWKINIDKHSINNENIYQAFDDLADGKIQCAALVTKAPVNAIDSRLGITTDGKAKKYKLIGLSKRLIEKLNEGKKYYNEITLNNSSYVYLDDSVSTIEVGAQIIAHKEIFSEIPNHIIDILNNEKAQNTHGLIEKDYKLQSNFSNNEVVSVYKKWIFLLSVVFFPTILSFFFCFLRKLFDDKNSQINSLSTKLNEQKISIENQYRSRLENNNQEIVNLKNRINENERITNKLQEASKSKEEEVNQLSKKLSILKTKLQKKNDELSDSFQKLKKNTGGISDDRKNRLEYRIKQLELENKNLKSNFRRSLEIGINNEGKLYFTLNLLDSRLQNIAYNIGNPNDPRRAFLYLLSYAYAKKYNKPFEYPNEEDQHEINGRLTKDLAKYTKCKIVNGDYLQRTGKIELRIKKEDIEIVNPELMSNFDEIKKILMLYK